MANGTVGAGMKELLEISNKKAERSIKPFVIGRKNWLLSNAPKGATSSESLYSIMETADAYVAFPPTSVLSTGIWF